MGKKEDENHKESKFWMIGMIAVIIAVVALVITAILIQHEQLSTEAAKAAVVQKD